MLRSGKAHWITIFGILGVIALIAIFLISGESPTGVANRFLVALAKGDVDTLTDLSYYEGSKETLREKWKYATQVSGPYYRFAWTITTTKQPDDKSAAVRTSMFRGFGPGSFGENFDIPLVKVDGKWKVDVHAISRGLFPGLPR